ncbi:hypothetical protein ACCO45_011508 [Purpureocillium lilacinum]|uniref:Uncharacterized protein n=1 Tax=Purpureocillium lilacinum TaxID=33203 RepID=A0ACC4DCJ0_PURLI
MAVCAPSLSAPPSLGLPSLDSLELFTGLGEKMRDRVCTWRRTCGRRLAGAAVVASGPCQGQSPGQSQWSQLNGRRRHDTKAGPGRDGDAIQRHPFHPLRTGICQHLQQARARQFGPASGWAEPPRWADGDPGMGSLGQALWGPGGGPVGGAPVDQWTLVAGAGPCAGFKVHVPWMDAGGSSSSIAAGGGGKGLVSSGPSISSGRASYGWAGCCHRAVRLLGRNGRVDERDFAGMLKALESQP